MDDFKIGLFADSKVGLQVTEFMVKNHRTDLGFVCVTKSESPIVTLCSEQKFDPNMVLVYGDHDFKTKINQQKFDYFVLAWWPYIIDASLFNIPKKGTLNFHPSLLPFNKGKHPTFWNIIEEVPYGVSIHFVDEGIDSGDVVFQKEIKKTWCDTGGTLYEKALKNIVDLYVENYNNIKNGNYMRTKQHSGRGSFHYAKELKAYLHIDLNKSYTARELFNLLRAKKFPNADKCFFYEDNAKYEVDINILPPP